jgi:AcrR family transcriptional regulator
LDLRERFSQTFSELFREGADTLSFRSRITMGSKERIERRKVMLRQEILDAAMEMFAKDGYTHVSMRKIAYKIEYSPTIIYHYFKDKAHLLTCVCDDIFAELIKRFEALGPDSGDPLARLRMGLHIYIDFGLKHPNHYQVAFMTSLAETTRYDFEGSIHQEAFNFIRSAVKECVRQNKVRKHDVETTSQALWVAVHGLTSMLIVDRDFPWVNQDKLINYLIDLLIKGMKYSYKDSPHGEEKVKG